MALAGLVSACFFMDASVLTVPSQALKEALLGLSYKGTNAIHIGSALRVHLRSPPPALQNKNFKGTQIFIPEQMVISLVLP